jgi:hypothetical protein
VTTCDKGQVSEAVPAPTPNTLPREGHGKLALNALALEPTSQFNPLGSTGRRYRAPSVWVSLSTAVVLGVDASESLHQTQIASGQRFDVCHGNVLIDLVDAGVGRAQLNDLGAQCGNEAPVAGAAAGGQLSV